MGVLQKMFNRELADIITGKKIVAGVIRQVLEAKGVEVTIEQASAIASAFSVDRSDDVLFECESISSDEQSPITIESGELGDALHRIESDLSQAVNDSMLGLVGETSDSIVERLLSQESDFLVERRAQRGQFDDLIRSIWGKAFDRLDALISIVEEAIGQAGSQIHCNNPEVTTTDIVLFGLCRQSARTASEVLTLLRAGFADGAMARWRSLHELAVIAAFLRKQDEETATRFLDHDIVSRYRSMRAYREHGASIGAEPLREEDVRVLKHDYDQALRKYGAEFGSDYGWASSVIGSRKPTFAEIERCVELAHWRPYYGLACSRLHATSHGMMFSLGASKQGPTGGECFPTVFGLGEPGRCTVMSVGCSAVSMLAHTPDLDGLVAAQVIQRLIDEAVASFDFAANQMDGAEEIDLHEFGLSISEDVPAEF